jgi:hypothetical protein
MKAYRIYHVNEQGEKIYSCNSPGYWAHHCSDPEYAVPFLEFDKAIKDAEFDEKYVSPSGVKRYVEEYEETRPLLRNKYKGGVILAEFKRYYTDSCCYTEAIAE